MSEYTALRDIVVFRPLERPVQCSWRQSQFKAPWTRTVGLLARELSNLRAERAVLQIDMAEANIRLDGMPRADRQARSPGVVLSLFSAKLKHDLRYEVGTYDDWRDNVRAIALALEALRAVDRYGVTRSGEQYAGWKQLTAGTVGDGDPDRGAELVEEAGSVSDALFAAHPDHGGEPADFRDVIAYRDSVKAAA